MGEIADALRRTGASSGARSREERAALPGARYRDPGVRPGMPMAAGVLLHPTDPAIVSEDGPELEGCRQLALRLRSELQRRGARSVAVVSPLRDDGKTTASCNLAIGLASLEAERRVALVGLDLRRPCLARVLGIEVKVGIEQLLAGTASLDEVRIPIAAPGLDAYAALKPHRAAHEVLTQRHLAEVIAEMERLYDAVIIDTPPVLLVPDARLILEHVPFCLPVARAGRTRIRAFREMLDALPKHQVLGTLLNGSRRHGHYYQAYSYLSEDEDESSDGHEPSRGGRGGQDG